MQTYEFFAIPENGVIFLPENLKDRITSTVKVFVMEVTTEKADDDKNNSPPKSSLILPPTLDTRGWKFDREEANER